MACLALATSAAIGRGQTPPTALSIRPNIVVFLLDDTNPMDGRLWSDAQLTPTLHDRFVAHGVHFSNAIGETPLCCPARATLLTGLHTHNHGVKVNDVRLFDPSETVATELRSAGYQTMLIGKYMNHPQSLTGDLWTQHAAPWSDFDIFTSPFSAQSGYFTDYTVTTKDGTVLRPAEHSTQFITERAVAHMAATAPRKPIFAVLSVHDTHQPNIPMAQFASDPRCDSMAPWNPPNYNEADVSDKPDYMRQLPLLPSPDGWPLVAYCREMLGVDWMVRQVTDELAAEGRLDDTLLVFTADNGMAWGQHRLEFKQVPYATPVPLYMSWPTRWGDDPRTIDELTSNIDLAPTFCAVGGCTLGPFPGGQTAPDGVSLLPLLDGQTANLGRDALLETEWESRPWAAVRTTDLSDLGRWHYIERQGGFRELYDVDPGADPWELDNVAYEPAYADISARLHDRLLELLAEGRPPSQATLTIAQDSLPNGEQDFSFSGDLGSFALDDDPSSPLAQTKVVGALDAGVYTVWQTPVAGWSLVSIMCPPGSVIDLAAGWATVPLLSGDQATCTFKNVGPSRSPRPDAAIALAGAGPYKGDDLYRASPVKLQTQRRTAIAAGHDYEYWVVIQNDSSQPDTLTVSAVSSGAPTMTAAFTVDGFDVTAAVLSGTYVTGPLAAGGSSLLLLRVTVAPGAVVGSVNKVVMRIASASAPTVVDVVRAVTAR